MDGNEFVELFGLLLILGGLVFGWVLGSRVIECSSEWFGVRVLLSCVFA